MPAGVSGMAVSSDAASATKTDELIPSCMPVRFSAWITKKTRAPSSSQTATVIAPTGSSTRGVSAPVLPSWKRS